MNDKKTEIEEKLIANILESINTDDEPFRKKGKRLINLWKTSDDFTKEMLDDLFITLSGYSLSTLLKDSGYEEEKDKKNIIELFQLGDDIEIPELNHKGKIIDIIKEEGVRPAYRTDVDGIQYAYELVNLNNDIYSKAVLRRYTQEDLSILDNFVDLAHFEEHIKTAKNPFPDEMILSGKLFTMEGYDMSGKDLSYVSIDNNERLWIRTNDRYESVDNVIFGIEHGLDWIRNDIGYATTKTEYKAEEENVVKPKVRKNR